MAGVFFSAPAGAEETKPVFVVGGVRSQVSGKEWKDVGIGFGVSNLITQSVFNSGLFRAIEEDPEVTEAIRKHRELFWAYSGKASDGEIKSLSEPLNADCVFYGVIEKCKTERTKAFAGFVSRYQTKVRVIFALKMIEKETGRVFVSKGEGSSEKGASAVVFEARDGKIDFNSTMAGIAVESAVRDAVENLLKDYTNK